MPNAISEFKPVITKLFGDYPLARIIDFLLQNKDKEFTISQISDGAGVSRSTLWESKYLVTMAEDGLIINTGEIGNARLYKLNTEAENVKLLIHLYEKLSGGQKFYDKDR
jgi:hypothetical protein